MVAILAAFQSDSHYNNASCDLFGDWSQVTLLIDIHGSARSLTFPKDSLSEDQLLTSAQKVHAIYFLPQLGFERTLTIVLRACVEERG